jgi:hypothetical protein
LNRISHKESTRGQHLFWLKASAFFSSQTKFSCQEMQQLILGVSNTIKWVIQPHLNFYKYLSLIFSLFSDL